MDPNGNENGQSVPPKVDLRKQVGQPPQGASGAGPGKNLQTMHIELPEEEPVAAPVPPPPKPTPTDPRATVVVKPMPVVPPTDPRATVVVKPMPVVPPRGERHQTMEIQADALTVGAVAPVAPPAPAPARGPTPSPTVSVKPIGSPPMPVIPAAKRETSRIPLDLAKPALGAPGRPLPGPTTIRVKPVVVRQTVDLAQAVPDGAGNAAPTPPPVSPESGKRKTSRISLESVLSSQPGSASQTAEITPPEADDEPRTIRIKRSAERPTAVTTPVSAPISPGQTARLELPPDTPAAAPGTTGSPTPTRKKTIRMRRPGMEDGAEEGVSSTASAVARPEPVAQKTDDVPHFTFGILAVVSVLVMAVLLWVLMAQAFGRDISLTQLSYGWRDCPFSWFGQMGR
jgi:hypothetical protein